MPGGFEFGIDDRRLHARGELAGGSEVRAEIDGRRINASVIAAGEKRHVFLDGHVWQLAAVDPLFHGGEGSGHDGGVTAPMPGKIIALLAQPGPVTKGQPLLILEAMKMEHTLAAPADGEVKVFRCAVGEQVSEGVELVEFAKRQ
jgi:3-methylcrotonyl-CoA carboxylase alpha subunit